MLCLPAARGMSPGQKAADFESQTGRAALHLVALRFELRRQALLRGVGNQTRERHIPRDCGEDLVQAHYGVTAAQHATAVAGIKL